MPAPALSRPPCCTTRRLSAPEPPPLGLNGSQLQLHTHHAYAPGTHACSIRAPAHACAHSHARTHAHTATCSSQHTSTLLPATYNARVRVSHLSIPSRVHSRQTHPHVLSPVVLLGATIASLAMLTGCSSCLQSGHVPLSRFWFSFFLAAESARIQCAWNGPSKRRQGCVGANPDLCVPLSCPLPRARAGARAPSPVRVQRAMHVGPALASCRVVAWEQLPRAPRASVPASASGG